MKDGMSCPISSSCTPVSLTTLTKFKTLSTKSTLIDPAVFCAREGQTKTLQLQNNLRCHTTHVFNCILITEPI